MHIIPTERSERREAGIKVKKLYLNKCSPYFFSCSWIYLIFYPPLSMEVHHHAHNPAPDSHRGLRKKWTHYFWEFLMLFLAIFCGFLAENQREHMVEHSREKQYMRSMLIDLSADSARYTRGIGRKEQRIKAIDSVFLFFNAHPSATSISGRVIKYFRRATFDQNFTRNTITINQLKNAGGMRLIRDKPVIDSITSYDFQCEDYVNLYGEYYNSHQQLAYRYMEKLVPASALLQLYIQNNSTAYVTNIPDSIMIEINRTQLNEQLNLLMQVKIFAWQEIGEFQKLKNSATNLMELIKKDYHLK